MGSFSVGKGKQSHLRGFKRVTINKWEDKLLLNLLDSTHVEIGQFYGPYSKVRPAKLKLERLPFPLARFQDREI